VISVAVAVVVAAVDAVDVGVVNVGAVDVGAVDVGPWWGCLAGRSFPDGRRKIIRSQQQRSSNEKEIRTTARMRNKFASLQTAGLFGTCPEQKAISEYNSRSQEQGWIDGLTWIWLSQIMLAVAVGSASKRTRRNVSTKLIPNRWV
jgi:hypothetical protein